MAPRSNATFAKRQRERARQEKRQDKLERRLRRKQERNESPELLESGEFDLNPEAPSLSEPPSDTTMADASAAPTEREL